MLDKILFVLWIFLGIAVLISGPTRIAYGCVWLCFLAELGLRIYEKHKKENNNDSSRIN